MLTVTFFEMDPCRAFAKVSSQIAIEFSQFSTLLPALAFTAFRISRVRFAASAALSFVMETNAQISINKGGFSQVLLELIRSVKIM